MDKLKQLWEKLAKENSRYYINTDRGREITEEKFRRSGEIDFKKLIYLDEVLDKYWPLIEKNFLEIGCGTGRMTEFVAPYCNNVIAVDISGEMIKQGKRRLKDIKNIIWFETDGKTMPLPNDMVDIAFSYIVFQHMKDKKMVEANFREVYRVLKTGGIFKVLLRTDKVDLKKWWGGVSYDDDSIKLLCKDTGFSIIKTEKVKNYGVWLWLKK